MALDKTLQEFVSNYSATKGLDTSGIVPGQTPVGELPTVNEDPVMMILPRVSSMTEGEFLKFIVDLTTQYNLGNEEMMAGEQPMMGEVAMQSDPMMAGMGPAVDNMAMPQPVMDIDPAMFSDVDNSLAGAEQAIIQAESLSPSGI